jgi:hypothetical protein
VQAVRKMERLHLQKPICQKAVWPWFDKRMRRSMQKILIATLREGHFKKKGTLVGIERKLA